MSGVFFTSDLHLGHDMAAILRGHFGDKAVLEHDHTVISMLQMQLDKRTVLYVLGDVSMNMNRLSMIMQLPGRKILVRGNHDTYPLMQYLAAGFEEVYGLVKYKSMWLSHPPIHPQEMYRAVANVHGHIHWTAQNQQPPFPFINVNWDFWQRAVSLDEIKSIVEAKYVTYPFHDDKTVKA
jgi:calcineurin-like phosphoesterase family protein